MTRAAIAAQKNLPKPNDANRLQRLKKYLQTDQDWTDEEDQQLMSACKAEIEKGVEAYKALPPQVEGEFFDYMFAELPHDLKLQKEQFLKGLKHHG